MPAKSKSRSVTPKKKRVGSSSPRRPAPVAIVNQSPAKAPSGARASMQRGGSIAPLTPAPISDGNTIRGITIDHSKWFTNADTICLPRKPFLKRQWGVFSIEVALNLFEPWERVTILILFGVILAPVVWKVGSVLVWCFEWIAHWLLLDEHLAAAAAATMASSASMPTILPVEGDAQLNGL